jgi:hypothetical protein
MIRVVIPAHLKTLISHHGEVHLEVHAPITIASVLTALEDQHPELRGTIRDTRTLKRRPFIRFFACEEDLSNDPTDDVLPAEVVSGREPLYVVGAMAGGA